MFVELEFPTLLVIDLTHPGFFQSRCPYDSRMQALGSSYHTLYSVIPSTDTVHPRTDYSIPMLYSTIELSASVDVLKTVAVVVKMIVLISETVRQ